MGNFLGYIQFIYSFELRFRLQQVALTGDIEKAFLMLMNERDRDSPRFLWVADPHVEPPEIVTLCFTELCLECHPVRSS